MARAAEFVQTDLEPSLKNIVDQTSLKWIFVGGKGGVGKTTTRMVSQHIGKPFSLHHIDRAFHWRVISDRCIKAYAQSLCTGEVLKSVQLSKVRESVLIISTDPAHNLSDAFGQKFSSKPTLVQGFANLFAMELDPDKNRLKPENPVAGSGEDPPFDALNDVLTPNAMPGADELWAFSQFMNRIHDMKHSVIVFDTAPTGHTLRMLSMPNALGQFVKMMMVIPKLVAGVAKMLGKRNAGIDNFLANDESTKLTQVKERLTNAQLTTFVCVCIAEFLPLYETERLVQELRKQGIDTHNIVVNQLNMRRPGDDPCCLCSARQKIQKKYLAQIEDLYTDFHVTKLPLLADEVRGVEQLCPFSEHLLHPYTPEQKCR